MKKLVYMATILVATQSFAVDRLCSYVGVDLGLSSREIVTYRLKCDDKMCVVLHNGKGEIYFTQEIRKAERLERCDNLKRVVKLYLDK